MRRPYKHIDLGELFSEFEHTPDDSNWNTISGGLNSKSAAGGLSKMFSDYKVTPSKDVWTAISKAQHPQRRKRLVVFWWSSGVAASLVGLLFISSLFSSELNNSFSNYSPRISGKHTASLNKPGDTSDAFTTTGDSELENSSKSIHQSVVNEIAASETITQRKEPTTTTNPLAQSTDKKTPNSAAKSAYNDLLATFHIEKKDVSEASPFQKLVKLLPRLYNEHLVTPQSGLVGTSALAWYGAIPAEPKKSSAQSTILASSLFTNSSSLAYHDAPITGNSPNSFTDITSTPLTEEATNGILPSSKSLSAREDFKTPIYLSLQLEKQLKIGYKNRLHVGVGVGALFVRSSQKYNSSLAYGLTTIETKTSISRNYIAVPLYMKYDFISKSKWTMYTSLGGSSEFSLNGKVTTDDFKNGELENSFTSNLNLGVGQFNINTGVGVNVRIGKHLSAFSEVSLARYFYQSHYTFWSNRELWPNLKTGISLRI